MSVRPAGRDEAEILSRLSLENCEDGWNAGSFLPEFDRGSVVSCVCEGETVIGFAVISVSFDEGYLHLICIDGDHRRQGHATALLGYSEHEAYEKGARRIILDVRVSNEAAIDLYKSRGYDILCTRHGFYSHPSEDAFTMVKELDNE